MAKNYYLVLGIPADASAAEIREAYHRLARLYHPDISGSESSPAFRDVQEAWETLGDPERRRAYDARARRSASRPRRPPTAGPADPSTGIPPAADPFFLPTLDWDEGRRIVHFGLQMSPQEARAGGDFSLRVPVRAPCAACGGAGYHVFFSCPACHGEGYGVHWTTLPVRIPSGLRHDDTLELALDPFGWPAGRLLLHVAVRAA